MLLSAGEIRNVRDGVASPEDDIFALGGLVYELITGDAPYSSTHTADDIRNEMPAAFAATRWLK